MKIKTTFALISFMSGSLLITPVMQAADITATGSGNWSSTVPDAPWPGGVAPGTNDSVDVEPPFNITVDTNVTIGYLYGDGAVTMGAGVTLTVLGDANGAFGAQSLAVLTATAVSNTVIYMCNAFHAKRTDYYNLVLQNSTTNSYDFYNGVIPGSGAVAMNIARDLTVNGKIKVQQGADITVGGNLIVGTNSTWDCSSFRLLVTSNTTLNGLLIDLDGALGTNYFGGGMTVNPSVGGGWNISDVTQWAVAGNLTNNGTIAGGKGYGSITFYGTGVISGKAFKIPTLTINGTSTIAATITLLTNTPTLNGTLVFDLANTNQLILQSYPTNLLTLYYNGNLNVINSGPPPVAGQVYKLFVATNYDGTFSAISLPSLPSGLAWVDNLLTSGSLTVSGAVAGSPVLSISRIGGALTLSWDSGTFPGYSVQGQTNATGLSTNWGPTTSGTTSPFNININPNNPSVFFRLYHP